MQPHHAKGNADVVDIDEWPNAKKLVQRCHDFFEEIKNMTPGKALEEKLNASYGAGNPFFEDFKELTMTGIEEGWAANEEISGPEYRRSKVVQPSAETLFFSIHTVYMDSAANDEILGQYHKHVYGELNCVFPIDETAQIKGMQGWHGLGWTSPGPGTHHYPQVRGGRLAVLFFLPSGRITYEVSPSEPQPLMT